MFYLERQGVSPDDAKAIITRVFCWGVSAATMRHEFSATPADAPPVKVRAQKPAQIPLIADLAKPRQVARTWPADFTLTDALIKFATDRGFNQVEAQRMWERFRDRNQAKGEKYADWNAAWRTWVNNQVEFKNRDNNARKPDHIDGRL